MITCRSNPLSIPQPAPARRKAGKTKMALQDLCQKNVARRFVAWLEANGAQVLPGSNEYEIIRFVGQGKTSIVYRNKHGSVSAATGAAPAAYEAFEKGGAWNGGGKTQRAQRRAKERAALIITIAARDGWKCIYCGAKLSFETATIEHFAPLSRCGKDAVLNMLLACQACNKEAGNMGVAQKIRLAIKKHSSTK